MRGGTWFGCGGGGARLVTGVSARALVEGVGVGVRQIGGLRGLFDCGKGVILGERRD